MPPAPTAHRLAAHRLAAHPALLTSDLARAIREDLISYGEARVEGPEHLATRVANAVDRAARGTGITVTWVRTAHGWAVYAA